MTNRELLPYDEEDSNRAALLQRAVAVANIAPVSDDEEPLDTAFKVTRCEIKVTNTETQENREVVVQPSHGWGVVRAAVRADRVGIPGTLGGETVMPFAEAYAQYAELAAQPPTETEERRVSRTLERVVEVGGQSATLRLEIEDRHIEDEDLPTVATFSVRRDLPDGKLFHQKAVIYSSGVFMNLVGNEGIYENDGLLCEGAEARAIAGQHLQEDVFPVSRSLDLAACNQVLDFGLV